MTADRRARLAEALDDLQGEVWLPPRLRTPIADALLPIVDALCREAAAAALEEAAEDLDRHLMDHMRRTSSRAEDDSR